MFFDKHCLQCKLNLKNLISMQMVLPVKMYHNSTRKCSQSMGYFKPNKMTFPCSLVQASLPTINTGALVIRVQFCSKYVLFEQHDPAKQGAHLWHCEVELLNINSSCCAHILRTRYLHTSCTCSHTDIESYLKDHWYMLEKARKITLICSSAVSDIVNTSSPFQKKIKVIG